MTTQWIIYYIANFTDVQQKMREEISSVIGDRMPVQDNKNQLHYVQAVIHEVMRISAVAPIIPHATAVDTKLGISFDL